MNRLKDKVAVITGSTSGIGAAMARLFAKEGATVVICGRREKRGNALSQEIRKNGGGSIVNIGSMASDESAYVTGQILDVDGGISCHVATVAQFRRGESHTWDH